MRIESYVGDKATADILARHIAHIYGGVTIVTGIGLTIEWGTEASYILTTFAEDTPANPRKPDTTGTRSAFRALVQVVVNESNEDSILVAFDNEHVFIERSIPKHGDA